MRGRIRSAALTTPAETSTLALAARSRAGLQVIKPDASSTERETAAALANDEVLVFSASAVPAAGSGHLGNRAVQLKLRSPLTLA